MCRVSEYWNFNGYHVHTIFSISRNHQKCVVIWNLLSNSRYFDASTTTDLDFKILEKNIERERRGEERVRERKREREDGEMKWCTYFNHIYKK